MAETAEMSPIEAAMGFMIDLDGADAEMYRRGIFGIFAGMFEEAAERAGTRKLVMVGDQLATDIRGARQFGIDSALVLSGLTRPGTEIVPEEAPTFVLEDLR